MTVTAKNTRVQYTGNGLVATYAYDWKILDQADLVVITTDLLGADTTLVLGVGYTVTGAGNDSGGNVVLTNNLATGHLLTVYMDMDIDQPTDLTNQQSPFLERIESALDRQALVSQQLAEKLGRCIQLKPTSTDSSDDLQELLESVDTNATVAAASAAAAQAAQVATEATRDSVVADAEAAAAAAAGPFATAASDSADDAAASAALATSALGNLTHKETVSGSPKDTFTLPWAYDHTNKALMVFIDGVYQDPASFSCPSSTTVTLDASAAVGETVYFRSGLATAPDLTPQVSACQAAQLAAESAKDDAEQALSDIENLNLDDTTSRDLAVFNAFLNQIGLGRASGAIPSGYMHLFLSDELATKTNATYDAAGDYYYNPASYVDETANISSIAQINFNQSGTCTLTALRDGTLTGGCGTQDETGSSVDLIFSAAKSIGKIEFYNYANTERLKAFTVRRYDSGAWTKVPITAITGGTIINTDEGQVSNANGWVACEFSAVSDTRFRLSFTSVWGVGDANAWLPEAKIYSYSPPPSMTLIPTAITAGSAPETVDIYLLHKAVDAATANTDFKARATRDGGSNWSAHVTLAEVCQYDSDYKLYKGRADLAALASGTSVAWEFTTLNAKAQRVRAAAMILNS